MRKHPISTIVNFCSNESRFIKAGLEQALYFSQQVIVPVCDHFFDGKIENRPLLEQVYAAFPECQFVEYPFIPELIHKKYWESIDPAHFWHSFSRLVGYSFVEKEIESLLFLDADEVPDGKRFAQWLDMSDYKQHTALKLANYWYFREPSNQALKFEDSAVLAQKKSLELEILLHEEERDAIYNLLPGPKKRNVTGCDGTPLLHHYSWVRTQDEMLKKVKAWGHKGDRDWNLLVEEEFKSPFKGTDFVHGYTYKIVKPFFDIHLGEVRFEPRGAPNVKKLTKEETLRLIKKRKFWNFLDF